MTTFSDGWTREAGWYTHPEYGRICKERDGWWYVYRNQDEDSGPVPFRTLFAAKQYLYRKQEKQPGLELEDSPSIKVYYITFYKVVENKNVESWRIVETENDMDTEKGLLKEIGATENREKTKVIIRNWKKLNQ